MMKTGQGGLLNNNTYNIQSTLMGIMTDRFIERSGFIAIHRGTNVVTRDDMKKAIIYECLSPSAGGAEISPYFEQTMINEIDFSNLPEFIRNRALDEWDELSGIKQETTDTKELASRTTNFILVNRFDGYYEGKNQSECEEGDEEGDEGGEEGGEEGDEGGEEGDEEGDEGGDEGDDEGDEGDEGSEEGDEEGDEGGEDYNNICTGSDCDFCKELYILEAYISSGYERGGSAIEKIVYSCIQKL
jgi:hypothetical protein